MPDYTGRTERSVKNMQNIELPEISKIAAETLGVRGGFLTVANRDKLNVMTIGWGSTGYIWGLPVFTVLVRQSRHTYALMEPSDYFTLSIPLSDKHKEALALCGTRSGRYVDKFATGKIGILPGKTVDLPVIAGHCLQLECRTVYHQPMHKATLEANLADKWYGDEDMHIVFYGEILSSYITE